MAFNLSSRKHLSLHNGKDNGEINNSSFRLHEYNVLVTTTVTWVSTPPISNYYGDAENVITFLSHNVFEILDMKQTQVRN